ncbi:MAG: fibronectin type III domain-containing protein [bacterium]
MKLPLYHATKLWIYGFFIVFFGFSSLFAQNTIYVSLSGSNSAPYSSWATAATNIQTAVNAANTGDVVLVGDGTYTLTSNISITKGITVKSLNGSSSTAINGNNATRCLYVNHTNAVIEGFTITQGYNPGGFGGAVNIVSGGTVQNCIITSSQARDGGGVAIDNSGLVQNCLIFGNTANNNSGSGYGGGVRMLNGGITRNCLVSANSSANYGGGINIWESGLIQNCTIVNNTAPNGAGVRLRNNSVMENSISYLNNGLNWQTNGSGFSFQYNCTTPALPSGIGNTISDPQFVSSTTANYRLLSTSPLIDAGLNQAWMTTAKDLDGNNRIFGGLVGMGAYEFWNVDPPTLISPTSMSKNISINPVLSWDPTSGATSYTVKLSQDPEFTFNVLTYSGITSTSFALPNPLNYNQLYFWHVKSNLSEPIYSESWIFVTSLAPPTLEYPGGIYPTPISIPTDYPTSITFRWRNAPGAYMYKLQITSLEDTAFSAPIVDTWAGYGDTSYTVTNLQNWTNYLWRVYADNPATGQRSDWSSKFIFMTKLAAPVLITPANNSTSISVNPTLIWHNVPGAMFYTAEIYSDAACTNLIAQYSINSTGPTDTTTDVPFILNNLTEYYWRVKASHIVSSSNYSAISKFTTIRKVLPVLGWPLGAAQMNTGTVNFTWYLNDYEPTVTYDLLYSTGINFTSPAIISNIAITTYSTNSFLDGTKYYWKVRSKIGGIISAYAAVDSFITHGNTELLEPIPSWPCGGNIVYTLQQNLSWYLNNFSFGATYEVEFIAGAPTSLTGTPTILNIVGNTVLVNLIQGTQYSWSVRSKYGALYSNWSIPATFTTVSIPSVVVPTPSWPVGYPTVYTCLPTLYWYLGTVANGLKYEVEYVEGLNTPFTNIPTIQNITSLFVQLPILSAGKSYKWQVRSTDGVNYSVWSSMASFVVEGVVTPSPIVPTPSWPIGNATVYSTETILYWYLGASGAGLTYEVELTTGNLTGTANILNITDLFISTGQLQSGITYTWAVRSKLGTVYSVWSDPQTFTTISNTPTAAVPIPSWPIGGTTVYTDTQVLSWYMNSASAGLKYDLKYSTSPNASGGFMFSNLTTTQYTITNLQSGITYYWKVRSYDGTVYSNWSSPVSFVINAGNSPAMPISGSPINGVQLVTSAPVLSWFLPTNSSIESYEVQYDTTPEMNSAVSNTYTSTSAVVNNLKPMTEYYWRVRSKNSDGTYSAYSNISSFVSNSVTAVENDEVTPTEFILAQNYPNPFNPSTTIEFSIKEAGSYSLEVYNTLGEKVTTLLNGNLNVGNFKADFNASKLSSGVYFYKLTGTNVNIIKKMMLLK